MKLLRNYRKLSASSLVETIIATIISTICLSIAVLVFVQISNGSDSFIEAKASQSLNKRIYEDWLNSSIEDDMFSYKGFSIERIKNDKNKHKKWIEVTYKTTLINKTKNRRQFLNHLDL